MHTYTNQQTINNQNVSVVKESRYPIPWTGDPTKRPEDYYAQIKTVLTYKEDDKTIEITIPSSTDNRKRQLQVKVNGQDISINETGEVIPEVNDILNMELTFDIPEMNKALSMMPHLTSDNESIKTCLPFFYHEEAEYKLPKKYQQYEKKPDEADDYLLKSNGYLEKLVAPYISKMKSQPGKLREIYIPVVYKGIPHHWSVCILSIDKDNNPSLTYLESSTTPYIQNLNLEFYKKDILPAINKALKNNQYKTIDGKNIKTRVSKLFSLRGCGVAAFLNIEHLLNGSLDSYLGATIETDAIGRAKLAMKVAYHQRLINSLSMEKTDSEQQRRQYELEKVLRELVTHERILKVKATEAFPLKKDLSASIEEDLLRAIHKTISAKTSWQFGGLIGYSHHKADDAKTSIPKGVRKILNILKDTALSDSQKIKKIKKIAYDKQGFRGASIFPGLGLFTRSNDTKNFYKEIFDMCNSLKPDAPSIKP